MIKTQQQLADMRTLTARNLVNLTDIVRDLQAGLEDALTANEALSSRVDELLRERQAMIDNGTARAAEQLERLKTRLVFRVMLNSHPPREVIVCRGCNATVVAGTTLTHWVGCWVADALVATERVEA